jgi:hypothetical protein
MNNRENIKNILREYIEVGQKTQQDNVPFDERVQEILLKKINANIVKLSELAAKGDFTGIRNMLEKFKRSADTRISGLKYPQLDKPVPHDVNIHKNEEIDEPEEHWHQEKIDDKEEDKKERLRQKIRQEVKRLLGDE